MMLSLFLVMIPLIFPTEAGAQIVNGEQEQFKKTCPWVAPVIQTPTTVQDLHPAHVDIVGAFGDSISAGFGARKFYPFEFRGHSFSGGKGFDEKSSSANTVPYFLRYYNPNVTGYSTTNFRVPTTFDMKNPYRWSGGDGLNVAVSSSQSEQWPLEMARFEQQLKQQSPHYQDKYKMITIFLGENDLCGPLDACSSDPFTRQQVVDKFEKNMDHLLSTLISKFEYLYINLIELFWTSGLLSIESARTRCVAVETVVHECRCIHNSMNPNDIKANHTNWINAKRLDEVVEGMNAALQRLARKYDYAASLSFSDNEKTSGFKPRSDVAVNVVRAWEGVPVPDLSFLSELDCFHPSLKTHNIMANAVWNSMLGVHRAPIDLKNKTLLKPHCATETTKLTSWGTPGKTEQKDQSLIFI